MKSILIVAMAAALVLGCRNLGDSPESSKESSNPNIVSQDEMLSRNVANITKLALGMSKAQVVGIMGTFQTAPGDGNIANPFRSVLLMKFDDSYEILYYWTNNPPPFFHIRNSDTTPVVLKNGKVAGWGMAAANVVDPQE